MPPRFNDRGASSRQQPELHDSRMYDDGPYVREDFSHDRLGHSPPHGHGRTPPRHHDSWDSRGRAHNRDYDGTQGRGFQIRGRAAADDRHGHSHYHDRDREGYRSPTYRSTSRPRERVRSRSYSPNRRPRGPKYGGPPSREVMLDSLAPNIGEEDILRELKANYHVLDLDDVRVIRDRQTRESRGFGFIKFPSIESAQDFVEPNFPYIYLYGSGSLNDDDQAAKTRIAFSREREDKGRAAENEGDWICASCSALNFAGRQSCFRCHAEIMEMSAYQAQAQHQDYVNSGDSDAAMLGPPSQFLLLRGLDSNVTEELLSKGVGKLLKPNQQPQSSQQDSRRGKVSSTTGDANLGAREGSIRRIFLVRDRTNNESWKYGFAEFTTVEDAQAAVTRFNSFEKFTISSKPVSVSFIHTGVFVPVFDGITSERFTFSPYGNPATRLRYWNEGAYTSELIVAEPTDEESTSEAHRAKSTIDIAATAAAKEGLITSQDDSEAKSKKRKAEAKDKEKDITKSKKATPAHLQFWSNRHAELHGIKSRDQETERENKEGLPNTSATSTIIDPPARSYADPSKNCCYLCSRQFKSPAEVNKHERLSDLHRGNLQNEELKQKALAKLRKAGIQNATLALSEGDSSEYRDRAKERRQTFGASKKLSLPLKQPQAESKDDKETSAASAQSKGAALLGKMGWTSGEGLGAHGEGTTEAIATNVYAAGVGLGAEGGKVGDAVEEAARNSKGDYKEFLQRTKDKAKARYESMS